MATKLQHKNEKSLSVIVTKVEKISCIIHGLSLKIILYSIDKIKKVLYNTIDNQQRSLEERNAQRLFLFRK